MRVNFGNCEIMGKEEYGDGRNLGKVRKKRKYSPKSGNKGGKNCIKGQKKF